MNKEQQLPDQVERLALLADDESFELGDGVDVPVAAAARVV